MAGVGFELKKLFTARTAAGHIRAYSYSAMITAGPFALLTLMILGVQLLYHICGTPDAVTGVFVASVVYSFIFSQVISGGFTMVLTRYVADCLSVAHWQDVTSSLFGIGAILEVICGISGAIFLWGSPLPLLTKWLAYLFFAMLTFVWAEGVYLSAIKNYKRLLLGYFLGVLISFGLAYVLLFYGTSLMGADQAGLLAVDMGMAFIMLFFLLCITAHFGLPSEGMSFAFLPYYERHWRLFFISFFYMLGLFLPNIIIWQGPLGVSVADTFRYAPIYDVLTFYAFLSILPLMMMFVVSVETNFYDRYASYFIAVTRKGNFRSINDARKNLLYTLWFEMRHIVEFQLVFTLVWLALGSYLLSFAGITYGQINMFNVLLFGAFFTGLLQLVYILFIYFDYQQDVLYISAFFAVSNIVLGIIGLLFFGEPSYGFTFFVASATSCLLGFWRLSHFAKRINYFVFCSQPVFYMPPHGILTKIAEKLYGARYVNLELLGVEQEEAEQEKMREQKIQQAMNQKAPEDMDEIRDSINEIESGDTIKKIENDNKK